ncbi:hypothetical protein [Kribbella sp. DT2]|uniref:hypothetical protein n=1 Tax=Kribbella sp. DT2 TaxID=3393427 RepID=UPI003CFB7848
MTPKEPVGSVAEEAAKLFAVLRAAGAADFADPAARAEAGADAADEAAEAEAAAAGKERESAEADQSWAGEDQAHRTAAGEDQAHRTAAGEDQAHRTAGADDHEHGTNCQWCPVCQLIGKVRQTSPETIEQLSTAAAGVLGAVRSLVEAAAEAARQAKVDAESRAAGEQDTDRDTDRPARSRVDRIDVSEDPEPWD